MIKSIIREIVAICAEEGHVVHDDLAAFMVKSVVLSPSSGFKSDSEMYVDVQLLHPSLKGCLQLGHRYELLICLHKLQGQHLGLLPPRPASPSLGPPSL